MSRPLTYPRRGLHGEVVHTIGMHIVTGTLEPGDPLPPEDELIADLSVSRTVVREAVRVLAAKGLVKNEAAPDVFVLFHLAYDEQKDISTYSTGPMYGGYGWGWGGGWGSTTTDVRVREIIVGTLAIDLVDASRKQMVWRGLGTKEIDTNAKPEKRDQNITKAVEKIFKNYPPKVRT